jgi:hypothetical protein
MLELVQAGARLFWRAGGATQRRVVALPKGAFTSSSEPFYRIIKYGTVLVYIDRSRIAEAAATREPVRYGRVRRERCGVLGPALVVPPHTADVRPGNDR